jgi:integrase
LLSNSHPADVILAKGLVKYNVHEYATAGSNTVPAGRVHVALQARLAFKAHPHMLRHACGYALANKGHDTRALQAYLGHRNIQHTVRYTELSPTRFKDFWRT